MKISRIYHLLLSFFFITVMSYVSVGCGQSQTTLSTLKEKWNLFNNPTNFNLDYNVIWPDLPKAGKLDTIPWSDSYWPSYNGGIADRWNYSENSAIDSDEKPSDPDADDSFKYKLHSKEDLKKMNIETLKGLSPAEKYDIFTGNYDYPTVKSERQRTDPENPSWEGLCHGWAAAALNFKEPGTVTLKNKDNIEVPFGSSDIKGLLSYYHGYIGYSNFLILGSRCNIDPSDDPDKEKSPECRDTNAGAFHVVLTNQIGRMKQGFVADLSRYQQVWNHPIYGFKTKELETTPPSEGSTPGTVKEILVETEVSYITETSQSWEKLISEDQIVKNVFKYRLEINAEDLILGGEWLDEQRPDFLWIKDAPKFLGYFKRLEEIYLAAIKE